MNLFSNSLLDTNNLSEFHFKKSLAYSILYQIYVYYKVKVYLYKVV